ncbi:MAG: HPr kinase/phosphorylase [Brucellaceae bacterium]|nr:HPr kinase/phosphorylase [Brucellaceae bacterium]
MTAAPSENIHATALVCGDTGLLLRGPSGSGKSALALRLIGHMRRAGQFAALVADDRVLLRADGGRLVASAPEPIRGLAELRGYGIVSVPTVSQAVIDIVADLDGGARMPDPATVDLAGATCRLLRLPSGDVEAAMRISSLRWGSLPSGTPQFETGAAVRQSVRRISVFCTCVLTLPRHDGRPARTGRCSTGPRTRDRGGTGAIS